MELGPGEPEVEVLAEAAKRMIDRGFKDSDLAGQDIDTFETFAAIALVGRGSHPDGMPGVATFLASVDPGLMTGQTLLVDGGIVPDRPEGRRQSDRGCRLSRPRRGAEGATRPGRRAQGRPVLACKRPISVLMAAAHDRSAARPCC